jgi:hypothetical protein
MVLLKIVGDKITVELLGPSPTVAVRGPKGLSEVLATLQPGQAYAADASKGEYLIRIERGVLKFSRTPYTEKEDENTRAEVRFIRS